MKTNIILSILIFGFILLSCEKEKNKETRTQEIKVGDYSNMIINNYNTKLGRVDYLNIDLDNNGTEDIQFETTVFYWKAWRYHHRTTVRSLSENVEFLGIFSPDTMFFNKDTVIDTTGTDLVRIWELHTYSCRRFSENDTILSITQTFKLKPLEEGEVLDIYGTYNSGANIIFESPDSGWYNVTESNDTLWFNRYPRYQDCNNFPLDEIKYIGVKFKNELRLGWIKLLLPVEDQILIVESGIQK